MSRTGANPSVSQQTALGNWTPPVQASAHQTLARGCCRLFLQQAQWPGHDPDAAPAPPASNSHRTPFAASIYWTKAPQAGLCCLVPGLTWPWPLMVCQLDGFGAPPWGCHDRGPQHASTPPASPSGSSQKAPPLGPVTPLCPGCPLLDWADSKEGITLCIFTAPTA